MYHVISLLLSSSTGHARGVYVYVAPVRVQQCATRTTKSDTYITHIIPYRYVLYTGITRYICIQGFGVDTYGLTMESDNSDPPV